MALSQRIRKVRKLIKGTKLVSGKIGLEASAMFMEIP